MVEAAAVHGLDWSDCGGDDRRRRCGLVGLRPVYVGLLPLDFADWNDRKPRGGTARLHHSGPRPPLPRGRGILDGGRRRGEPRELGLRAIAHWIGETLRADPARTSIHRVAERFAEARG